MKYSILIRNAAVIDGTNNPRFAADIAVRGDRIEKVGALAGATADIELDAAGRAAAPGFIDAHSHDDRLMLSDPDMAPKISQGVTTVIAGSCGISLAPMPEGRRAHSIPPLNLLDEQGIWYRFPTFGAYIAELTARPPATNCALLVGHSSLRAAEMAGLDRPANAAEIERMRGRVREALEAGAVGVSTGFFYKPAAAATAEEVVEVCAPLGEFGGICCAHIRDEAGQVIEAMEELFRIGRELGAPVVISHHKVSGVQNHGRSAETLALIARRMKSQEIALDCYPYTASSSILTPGLVESASKTMITWSKPHPEFNCADLDEAAQRMGLEKDAAIKALSPAGAIYHSMAEDDVRRILAFAHTMIGSDGLPHDRPPHPRLWGAFARVLGHYAREVGLFPLETAVHKMTGLTAGYFGLKDRGVLKEGAFADIAVFDPEKVVDAATYTSPIQPAKGIDTVIVNGRIAWRHGKPGHARGGRVLLGRARAAR